jgi:CheY-like chemotaxis protein
MDTDARRMILVVEDEADLAATCARLLRHRGHSVITVGSRAAALARLADAPPSLLVSDIRLPDGDGLDVVRAAKTMQPPVPAVVMTARASQSGRMAALAAGAVGYLTKPFTAASFAALVDSALAAPVP